MKAEEKKEVRTYGAVRCRACGETIPARSRAVSVTTRTIIDGKVCKAETEWEHVVCPREV